MRQDQLIENKVLERSPRYSQTRLKEKLNERLGDVDLYFKRDPQQYYRNLSCQKQQKFLAKLKADYHQIILDYFNSEDKVNQEIDRFVEQAFFADLSVSKIVEIHMELMDNIAHKLKIEGLHEEFVLNYRLTLIDVIAHLCEMYRCSLPCQDIFQI